MPHRKLLKKKIHYNVRTSVVPLIHVAQWWAARLYKNTDFQILRSIIQATETYSATVKHLICFQLYSTSIILKQSFKTAQVLEKHRERSILLQHKFPVVNLYHIKQEQSLAVCVFFKKKQSAMFPPHTPFLTLTQHKYLKARP